MSHGVDGIFYGLAQQHNALIRRAEVFPTAIVNLTLRLLRHTILIMGCDAPPAVLNARVNARLVVFEADGL